MNFSDNSVPQDVGAEKAGPPLTLPYKSSRNQLKSSILSALRSM